MKGLRLTQHTPPARFDPKWHVVDATGQRLGHLASSVAGLLQGKHKPDHSPHLLNGDFVIIVNAARIEVSGKKLSQKTYYRHTGFIGHLRAVPLVRMLETHPDRVIQRAIKGMLPRTRLGRQMLRRLKVYSDGTHPHAAQVNAGTGRAARAAAAPAPRRRAAPPKAKAPAGRPPRAEATQEAAAPPSKGRRAVQAKAPTRPRRKAKTTGAAPAAGGRRTAPAKAKAPEAAATPAPKRRRTARAQATATTPRRRRATPAPADAPQEGPGTSPPEKTTGKESAEA